MNKTTANLQVTISAVPCPRAAEHKSEKNIMLRQWQDGTFFCPIHGDIKVVLP